MILLSALVRRKSSHINRYITFKQPHSIIRRRASMSVDATKLLFEGFLQKRKDSLKVWWVTYWFRLQNTTLFFYTEKNGGASHLRGYYYIYTVQSVREVDRADKKRFIFEIIMTNGKRKVLAAETAALRKKWVGHLWQAMHLSASWVSDSRDAYFEVDQQQDRLNIDTPVSSDQQQDRLNIDTPVSSDQQQDRLNIDTPVSSDQQQDRLNIDTPVSSDQQQDRLNIDTPVSSDQQQDRLSSGTPVSCDTDSVGDLLPARPISAPASSNHINPEVWSTTSPVCQPEEADCIFGIYQPTACTHQNPSDDDLNDTRWSGGLENTADTQGDYDVLPLRNKICVLETSAEAEEPIYDSPLSYRNFPAYQEESMENIYDMPSSLLRKLSVHNTDEKLKEEELFFTL
ncbi:uncharacterized protein LOC115387506 [Salarias fasciatus]|uniref:uncharacterized protein LOC115387506 n=1 Tax=Salarias fasciatus TaxID=181472 RepID=UPI001176C4C4|nr:uncharacterized protein LOC115387506 [Salarias fasciatus]